MRRGFILFSVCILLLSSCERRKSTSDAHRLQQIVRLNIQSEPPVLDPRKATDTTSIGVIDMCFEGLMKRRGNNRIEPALCHKVEISEDRKTYTFHLRPSKWWDETPLTAFDFENTWKTILKPTFASGFANDLYVIKNGMQAKLGQCSVNEVGVKALNASTLQVELEHPLPYFLELVATHSFLPVPAHIANEHPSWAANSGPLFIGNGPYKLKHWKHHNCIHMERNPHYWDADSLTIKEVHLSIVQDSTTELNMFETGDLEWAGYPLSTLPTDAIQALTQTNRLETYPLSGTYYYVFNIQQFPFNNINFRKAFSLAIDRTSIIQNITLSHQAPATGLIPPTMWDVEAYFEDHNVKEARLYLEQGLKETGYTRATLPPITLIYNSLEAHHKIAQAIQEQWFKNLGIRVQLVNKEWKVFLDELTHKQFHIARMGGIAGFNDPVTFLDLYKFPDSPNNFSGWSNQEFTALLHQAEQCLDPQKRILLLRQAERIFMEEMPIAPIYYYQGCYIKKDYLKGVKLSELYDFDFKFAFLESP